MSTILIDLSTSDKFFSYWDDFQTAILDSTDRLKENYVNLNPKDFVSFPAVIKDKKIVCFSALQMKSIWGNKIARASTRMWIHPDYRFKGMTRFTGGSKFLNTYYCLPLQMAKARMLGLDCVFITREENPKAFFKEYRKLIKSNCNEDFAPLDYMIDTCGITPVPDTCKQYVMITHLTDDGPNVWNNFMSKFKL